MITPLPPLPELHEYWDRPAEAAVGEMDVNAIHLRVGIAAHTWETVEMNMADIFTKLVDGTYPAPQRVFGLIVAANAKVDALNAASEVAFYWKKVAKEDIDYYKLLMKHYKGASGRRNEIVHALVQGFSVGGVDKGWYLTPPYHATNKNALPWEAFNKPDPTFPMRYRYNAANIQHFIDRFVLLRGWLNRFSAAYELTYP